MSDASIPLKLQQETSKTRIPLGRFSPKLERALECEKGAQRLAMLQFDLEDYFRSVQMILNASVAIESLLVHAAKMLDQSRKIAGPVVRNSLSASYEAILCQVDSIAAEAEFDGRNYATGNFLEVSFDQDGTNVLTVESSELTSASLGLSQAKVSLVTDAEIIGEMMRIEDALVTLSTRKTSIEMAASVLQSRLKFYADKAASLQDASRSLMLDGRAQLAIQEAATQRMTLEASTSFGTKSVKTMQSQNDNATSFQSIEPTMEDAADVTANDVGETEAAISDSERADNNNATQIQKMIDKLDPHLSEDMDLHAMELVRFLDEDDYMRQWIKFENGARDTFVVHLAAKYGDEIIDKVKVKYNVDETFKACVDRFMLSFIQSLAGKLDDADDSKEYLEAHLKTKYGIVYVICAKAIGAI